MRWTLLIAALVGCKPQDSGPAPDTCVESSRTPVEDPSQPAGGLSFSPQQAIDALAGDWEGDLTDVAGTEPMAMHVQFSGVAELILREAVYSGNGQADAMEVRDTGDPDLVDCTSSYAIGFQMSAATEDGRLDEGWSSTVEVSTPNAMSYVGRVAIDDMQGSARPTQFEGGELVVAGTMSAGQNYGTLEFHRDAGGAADTGMGMEAPDTGADPSQGIERLGTYALVRPP